MRPTTMLFGWGALALAICNSLPLVMPTPAQEMDHGRICLAQAMWSEARSEGEAAMAMVGSVALRRTRDPEHRWPQDICGVVQQAEQFQGVSRWPYPHRPELIDAYSWKRATEIADRLIANGTVDGPCSGAMYFNEHGDSRAPSFKCKLGALYFYGDK
jgi:spore germination cell wall hydrolase CwlJ-like protein